MVGRREEGARCAAIDCDGMQLNVASGYNNTQSTLNASRCVPSTARSAWAAQANASYRSAAVRWACVASSARANRRVDATSEASDVSDARSALRYWSSSASVSRWTRSASSRSRMSVAISPASSSPVFHGVTIWSSVPSPSSQLLCPSVRLLNDVCSRSVSADVLDTRSRRSNGDSEVVRDWSRIFLRGVLMRDEAGERTLASGEDFLERRASEDDKEGLRSRTRGSEVGEGSTLGAGAMEVRVDVPVVSHDSRRWSALVEGASVGRGIPLEGTTLPACALPPLARLIRGPSPTSPVALSFLGAGPAPTGATRDAAAPGGPAEARVPRGTTGFGNVELWRGRATGIERRVAGGTGATGAVTRRRFCAAGGSATPSDACAALAGVERVLADGAVDLSVDEDAAERTASEMSSSERQYALTDAYTVYPVRCPGASGDDAAQLDRFDAARSENKTRRHFG